MPRSFMRSIAVATAFVLVSSGAFAHDLKEVVVAFT